MPLLEVLVTGVGSSIAKATLKMWFKDDPISSEVGGTVVSILTKKIPDFLKRNQVSRSFDAIRDLSADSILKLLEKEGAEIDSDRLVIIANAAGETLNNVEIDTGILVSRNLDQEELVAYFCEKTGADGANPGLAGRDSENALFAESEQKIYRRILSQAAQLIVDMASNLPNFEERVNSELLKRVDSIAEQVIEGMNRVVSEGADAFETDYRNACIRKYDQLELFGVDLQENNQRYNLSIAYVTLMIERFPSRSDLNDQIEGCENGSDIRDSLSANEALVSHERLFVRGAAGSGKTTLLQWFAVFAAARRLEGELSYLNDYVPFLIKLRNFSETPLPTPEDFLSGASVALAGGAPQNWARSRLESGQALVLVDGLDEVAESRRGEVKRWLQDLISIFPSARYLVTTRPHAAEEGWLDTETFVDGELQEMARDDVEKFVDHWHEAVSAGIKDDEEKKKLPDLSVSLKEKLDKSPSIYRLATSPLLCALLCALHRQRVTNLPSGRIELYRCCIDMFFRRDEERLIDSADYIQLTDPQKEVLLRDLAWWMIRNGKTVATPEEVHRRFEKSYSLLCGEGGIENPGEMATTLFLQRIGIIRKMSHQKIDFPHRTFQEFLAAKAAIDDDDLGLLVKNAHDDQWRELVILAAGLLSPKKADLLISELLNFGDSNSKRRHSLYMVAVACMDVVVSRPRGSEVEKKVQSRLGEIVPPSSMSEAKVLASAGDLVVPYLSFRLSLRAAQSAASIRTLALIGTDSAFRELENYGLDQRSTARNQLVTSLKFTKDPTKYQEIAFSKISTHHLRYYGGHIEVISVFPNLSAVTLFNYFGLVSGVGVCPKVKSLKAWSSVIRIRRLLEIFPNLEKLQLEACEIPDIDELEDALTLKNFYYDAGYEDDEKRLSDFLFLSKMETLKEVHLTLHEISPSDLKFFNEQFSTVSLKVGMTLGRIISQLPNLE